MKNITDMTWKDAAIVDCRVLSATLETACGKLAQVPALKAERNARVIEPPLADGPFTDDTHRR